MQKVILLFCDKMSADALLCIKGTRQDDVMFFRCNNNITMFLKTNNRATLLR